MTKKVVIIGGGVAGESLALALLAALDARAVETVELLADEPMQNIELHALHSTDFPRLSIKDLSMGNDGRKYGKKYRRDIRRGGV